MFDVAVVGAGMAGLVCAQQLSQAGYKVVIAEKSRGLGGRVATRRLHGTCADHGLRYLKPKGHLLQQLVEVLCERHLLQIWTDTYEHLPDQQLKSAAEFPCYVAPDGMSAIAKFLATGLEIWLNQRVQALILTRDNFWSLELSNPNAESGTLQELSARAVVIAIPAPQALLLLEPLTKTGLNPVFLDNLRSVEFDPCLSVIAGYPAKMHQPVWKAVTFLDDPELAWVGLDSSKRIVAGQPIFVVQSSAGFAQRYLEEQDLNPAGRQLLACASKQLQPWLDTPDWMQVHRWRYANASRPWHETHLSVDSLPLVCCGDWCRGASPSSMPCTQVESAMLSGLAAAEQINRQLQQRALPGNKFFDF